MSYYFYLGGMMLPVPPPKMDTVINGRNRAVHLINEGEANVLKTTGLTEISFTALLPNREYPFASYDTSWQAGILDYAMGEASRRFGLSVGNSFSYKPAETFLAALKTAKDKRAPMRFIVTRMDGEYRSLWNTNMLCSIEQYEIGESHSLGYDAEVTIRLKEYKPFGTKSVEVTKDENGKETLRVKETRYMPDPVVPAAMKISKDMSVLEAVKNVTRGTGDWRSVMRANGITDPTEDVRGKVLRFV